MAIKIHRVYRWHIEFNRGRISLAFQEEFREGRAKSVVIPKIIDAVLRQQVRMQKCIDLLEEYFEFGNNEEIFDFPFRLTSYHLFPQLDVIFLLERNEKRSARIRNYQSFS